MNDKISATDGVAPASFDSDFESGNLDLAAKRNNDKNDEYDLLMRLDSNCRGH